MTSESSSTNSTAHKINELDLVFCVDCTGSMSSYIESAQRSIQSIVEAIVASEKCDVQFALVMYRDHTDDYVTKVCDFTTSRVKMLEYVSLMSASGGGDTPEAVTAALDQVSKLPYRKNSAKVCIFIADAPCHGLGLPGDHYPQGDPNNLDPIVIARDLLQKGIVLYCVGCEPTLSMYPVAVDFFRAIAKITMGQFLPLTSADLLPPVIIGGAQEQLSLERLMADMEREKAKAEADLKAKGEVITEEKLLQQVQVSMTSNASYVTNQLRVDDVYQGRDFKSSELMMAAPSLAQVRSQLPASTSFLSGVHAAAEAMPSMPYPVARNPALAPASDMLYAAPMAMPLAYPSSLSSAVPTAASSSYSAPMFAQQNVYNNSSTVDSEQVARMWNMSKARNSSS